MDYQKEYQKWLTSGVLTDREREILRRGRNAHTGSVPKNAQMADYRKATGLEAWFGFLYLEGDDTRLQDLFQEAMRISQERMENDETSKER